MPSTFTLPWGAWFGDRDRPFDLPDGWEAEVAEPRGAEPLTVAALHDALAAGIDAPPLRELARGRRNAVVVVEDLTRPARLAEVLPSVLSELQQGGLAPSAIRLLVGCGGHAPLDRPALVKKLG